jgi:hypothetical protein
LSRPTLDEFRRDLLFELALYGRAWRSASELHRAVSNHGDDYYRVALVLERLAADGKAELQVRGPVRRFRMVGQTTPAPHVHQPPRFDDDDNPLLA